MEVTVIFGRCNSQISKSGPRGLNSKKFRKSEKSLQPLKLFYVYVPPRAQFSMDAMDVPVSIKACCLRITQFGSQILAKTAVAKAMLSPVNLLSANILSVTLRREKCSK